MYKPDYMTVLSQEKQRPQIRLGLQGPPKSGKTWAALTFPNPVVLNLDRGLGAHNHRSDVFEVPFYKPEFCDKLVQRNPSAGANKPSPPNKKDAILKWLQTEALKLEVDQTLVVDGSTGLESAHDTQYNLEPWITNKGKVDEWGIYKSKNGFFSDICDALKALRCDVVYICHETPDRDKDGNLNGGVRPLLAGQAGDKLASHFTDWFRCHTFAKPRGDEQIKKALAYFNITSETFKQWSEKSPTDTLYLWQTMADEVAKCGTTTLVNCPKYILADYTSFLQHRRQQNK